MAQINYLTAVTFDFGAIATLPAELAALGVHRPLVVTDRGIAAAGLLNRVLDALPAGLPTALYQDAPTNPTEAATLDALAVYRDAGCDGLVAVGGGSSIDLAKGVALLADHPPPLAQYAAILGGVPRITDRVWPLIAIPTTAGTGSEVGRGALITLTDGRKLGFISPHLIPKRALCDPDLTLGLPPRLTAATGTDALTHCIECYLSPRINPPADAIALDGVNRATRWIEAAVQDGSNRTARWEMMMAALQGGLVFQKGLGAVHAMSHPLGGLAEPRLHHGTLNAVILPVVLVFNRDHVGDKYAVLRQAMGLPAGADLAQAIRELNHRIGLPANLAAMGVTPDVIPKMVEGAVADHSSATNPRPATAEDYARLFAAALA